MAGIGPPAVIDWCLQQSVLSYWTEVGYGSGALLQQVIHTTENVAAEECAVDSRPGNAVIVVVMYVLCVVNVLCCSVVKYTCSMYCSLYIPLVYVY